MADDELRLARLVEDLAASHGGAPVPILTHGDVETIVAALHDEMDAATAARAALAARDGLRIACAPGCNGCCENTIITLEPEAIAVARWLARPAQKAARDHFSAAYPRWRARVGPRLGELVERQRAGDLAGFESILLALWRERILCPFDHQGNCTIYPARPDVCRSCHALDTAERCSGASEGHPTVVDFPPLDAFTARVRPLHHSMHVAVGGSSLGPAPLAAAVHRLLAATGSPRAQGGPGRRAGGDKVGRNDPCPCGSGKKHKHCCGR